MYKCTLQTLLLNLDYTNKIIIAAGNPTSTTSEVMDLDNFDIVCKSKPGIERWGSTGSIIQDRVIICGGQSSIGGRHLDCLVIGKSN